jgi:hypothetical protein
MDSEKLIDKWADSTSLPPYEPPPYSRDGATTTGYYAARNEMTALAWPAMPPNNSAENTSFSAGNESNDIPSQYHPSTYDQTRQSYGYSGTPYDGRDNFMGNQQQQQQCTVVQQPGPVMLLSTGPLQDPPDDYLFYSIFVTVCCCWCVGISAIVSSAECRSAIATGDRLTADIKSRSARSKANLALGLGIAYLVVIGVYYGVKFTRH